MMGCFGHPTSWLCLALYPVPPAPATLPGHYSKLALTAGSLPLFTSPQEGPGSLVACSTWLGLIATCVPWLHPSTSSHCWQEGGSTLWCSLPAWNTHEALLNGPLKPPLPRLKLNQTAPQASPPIREWTGFTAQPCCTSSDDNCQLMISSCHSAVVKGAGFIYCQRGVKMRLTCHPHFKTRFTLVNMFLVTPSHAFSSHENVLIE